MMNSTEKMDWSPKIQASSMQSDINVTPLVDVCLVLLIIFMVVTPMIGSGVPFELPKTKQPEAIQEGANQLTVAIHANQEITINEDWVPMPLLQKKMQEIHALHPERKIRLKAEKSLQYGVILDVIKCVSAAGFEKVDLVTIRREQASSSS